MRKRLGENILDDNRLVYDDKLYRSVQKSDSPFVAYASERPQRDQRWRTKPWHEAELRKYLHSLRPEDKALLRLLADSGGSRLQRYLMDELPFLKGRSSNSKGFGTSMPVEVGQVQAAGFATWSSEFPLMSARNTFISASV